VVIVAACAFYAVMTGAAPSIIRALLFITLNEILKHCPQRSRDPLSVWCTALLIQLSISPWVIRSVGFQLSYLAMLGIFTVFPTLDGWFPAEGRHKSPAKLAWSSMALSTSCQIFTAPLVWKVFGTFPKHFLLTNLIAMPMTSVLMFSAVTCVGLSAAGICPEWLTWTTDTLAELLCKSLGIIAGM